MYCANKSINPFRTGTARQANEARGTGGQERGGGGYKNIFPKCETQVEAGGKTFASRHLTVQFGVPAWTEFFAILVGFAPPPHSCHVCVCECAAASAGVAGASFASHVFWCKVFAAFSIFYESSFCVNTLSTQGIAVGGKWKGERRGSEGAVSKQ